MLEHVEDLCGGGEVEAAALLVWWRAAGGDVDPVDEQRGRGVGTFDLLHLDGVTCLADDYGVTDLRGLLNMLKEGGPAEVIAAVRKAEATDPDGIRWPRFKPGDDATAAVCVF